MILVRLEKEEVVLYRAEHFAVAGKAKLPVELPGVVEAEDVFGLLGEEIFGFGEEFEGVALDDVFEVGEAAGFVLDEFVVLVTVVAMAMAMGLVKPLAMEIGSGVGNDGGYGTGGGDAFGSGSNFCRLQLWFFLLSCS
ncbi:hypothetical protein F0562_001965 [Nyssa sinensis]|uniref:Uncharacterized protein n=1 Tax=Nyssa sinensis TaxID=561372 RepID=A0A5J5C9M2_9ASTE|nr:hypothetical protein F0562_001965 [Nyssa sinensis]